MHYCHIPLARRENTWTQHFRAPSCLTFRYHWLFLQTKRLREGSHCTEEWGKTGLGIASWTATALELDGDPGVGQINPRLHQKSRFPAPQHHQRQNRSYSGSSGATYCCHKLLPWSRELWLCRWESSQQRKAQIGKLDGNRKGFDMDWKSDATCKWKL